MADAQWHDLGPLEELKKHPLRQITVGGTPIALSYSRGTFGAISGVCNHAGGPLGSGRLDGDYLVCPWHYWKYHRRTGKGEPGFEQDAVPSHEVKIENGRLFVNLAPATPRHKTPHKPHSLERPFSREEGPIRVLGISTTVMNGENPRYSTSDALLQSALDFAGQSLGVETRLIKLNNLNFRHCEGYYSKNEYACTWPCSITQMDPNDQLDQIYEGVVFWSDVVLLSTPIRWGSASSLYYKMVERMNCIQNQITTHNRVLIRNKVVAFIITGGQDNIQAVAGQMLGFFAELGFLFPQFPYIAHSLGWSAENMEKNVAYVQQSQELREGAEALVTRAVEMGRLLCSGGVTPERAVRPGRKADGLVAFGKG